MCENEEAECKIEILLDRMTLLYLLNSPICGHYAYYNIIETRSGSDLLSNRDCSRTATVSSWYQPSLAAITAKAVAAAQAVQLSSH
jgi:hypothetical protein